MVFQSNCRKRRATWLHPGLVRDTSMVVEATLHSAWKVEPKLSG